MVAGGTRRESGAKLQGIGTTWNDLASPVILIDHHQFESDETWARFERDTNVYRWRAIKDLIEFQVRIAPCAASAPAPASLNAPESTLVHIDPPQSRSIHLDTPHFDPPCACVCVCVRNRTALKIAPH